MLEDYAFWMSTPNLDFLEIAANAGFQRVVCDVEHNGFSPDRREALVVAARAMGLKVFFKIEGPEPVWVQRALDLAVDGSKPPEQRSRRPNFRPGAPAAMPPDAPRGSARLILAISRDATGKFCVCP